MAADQLRLQPDRTLDLDPDEFRRLGHAMVDHVAELLATMPGGKVTPGEPPSVVRAALGERPMPEHGADPGELLAEAAGFMRAHSLHNGHPRFWGYITSSAAPIGMLGDLLASGYNSNVGAAILSPAATEIETQAVRWIADLVGCPAGTGGLLVSGGNMANIVGLIAARRAKAPGDVRRDGVRAAPQLLVYASTDTHTWLQKAVDLMGLGTDAIRWIGTDAEGRLLAPALEQAVVRDLEAGHHPIAVVGTAGTVGTGVVDPLRAIADTCKRHDLWLHVDGAYGAPAAALPEAEPDLKAIALADSIALDPHKWLYAPLEAGCVLVRDPATLADAFSFDPTYYRFDGDPDDPPVNFFSLGPQNSRGFRALKVWLVLRQLGREGLIRLVREDIALAGAMHRAVAAHPDLEPLTCHLSISTFRYVPPELRDDPEGNAERIDQVNRELLDRLQRGGEVFISNAIVDGRFALRACIVNFRTTLADVEALPGIVVGAGETVSGER